MSVRQTWTINGRRFAKTRTERGGERYFIDGKPVQAWVWHDAICDAKHAESKQPA